MPLAAPFVADAEGHLISSTDVARLSQPLGHAHIDPGGRCSFRAGRAPTRSGPGYVNVRCDKEEETAAWRWVCLRWRYDGER